MTRRLRTARWMARVRLVAAGALVAGATGLSAQTQPGDTGFMTVSLEPRDAADGARRRPLQAADTVRIQVSLRDPSTGFAIGEVGVAAWIVPDDGRSCQDWFAAVGRAGEVPADVIALIGFDIVEATADNRVALVDPLFDIASANIKAITTMPGPLQAWAPGEDGQVVAAIGADDGGLYLVDPAAGRFRKAAFATRASSVVAAPGGFWVGLADGTATLVDAAGQQLRTENVGQGPVTVIAAEGVAPVALARGGTARVLSSAAYPPLDLRAQGLKQAALSALANAVFAISSDGNTLIRADLNDAADVRSFVLPFTAARIAASPDGRWLALSAPGGESIGIFDSQAMRLRWKLAMPDPVIEAGFSDSFLYLMHRQQGGVTRVTFDPAGNAPGLSAIAAGLPSDEPQVSGPLPRMARIPAGGMLVSSSRERRAYIVAESGAQAAMTMVPLRAGAPTGVIIRQRGLLPGKTAGTYIGYFTPPSEGHYRAVVRSESPDLLQCRSFVVGNPAPRTRTSAAVVRAQAPQLSAEMDRGQIRIKIDGAGGTPQQVMVMRPDGAWREFYEPVAVAGGIWSLPESAALPPGRYRLFVSLGGDDDVTLTRDIDVPESQP